MTRLTHVDESGQARMVDVGAKPDTDRVAVARGEIVMQPETLRLIRQGGIEKGDVLAVARVAGIMAAKRTHELIPMCHPLMLTHIALEFSFRPPEAENSEQPVPRPGRDRLADGPGRTETGEQSAIPLRGLRRYQPSAISHSLAAIEITATVKTTGKTGVEMEALTAVTVAALTIYDMAKAVDRGMRVQNVRLARKSGGKSGDIVLE